MLSGCSPFLSCSRSGARGLFGGIAFNHRKYPDADNVVSLQWGRAHRCLDGLSGHELFLGTGNDLVDAAALVGRCQRPLRRGIDKLSSDITTCECVWGTIA